MSTSSLQERLLSAFTNVNMRPEKVLDVSAVTSDGKNIKFIPTPKTSRSTKKVVPGLPIASDNYNSYQFVVLTLNPSFFKYADEYLRLFGNLKSQHKDKIQLPTLQVNIQSPNPKVTVAQTPKRGPGRPPKNPPSPRTPIPISFFGLPKSPIIQSSPVPMSVPQQPPVPVASPTRQPPVPISTSRLPVPLPVARQSPVPSPTRQSPVPLPSPTRQSPVLVPSPTRQSPVKEKYPRSIMKKSYKEREPKKVKFNDQGDFPKISEKQEIIPSFYPASPNLV